MALLIPKKKPWNDIQLDAYGLTGFNSPPSLVASPGNIVSQVGYASGIPLLAGQVVTNLWICVATAAAGTTPTTIKLAITDYAGARKGVTANVVADAKWTSTGYKSFALADPYTVETTDVYEIAFLQDGSWGTTALQLQRVAGATPTPSLNSRYAYATWGTGQTDIGTSLTFSAANTPLANWVGVS